MAKAGGKTPKQKGRPTKLNDEVVKKLTQAIRVGATYEIACLYAGITHQTLLNWKEIAKDKTSGPHFELFESITRAEGEAAIKWLALIEKHADADAHWAAWKLERRYPEQYGRTVQDRRNMDMSKLSDDELRAIAES